MKRRGRKPSKRNLQKAVQVAIARKLRAQRRFDRAADSMRRALAKLESAKAGLMNARDRLQRLG